MASNESIKARIRTIPDHPKPGIQFRDITTLLEDPVGLHLAVEQLAGAFKGIGVAKVAGIEARGFILGGAIAVALEAGFVAVRKAGKLPHTTIGVDYDLEYGTDRVEIHTDAVHRGERVLVIDDLIATGGTALATVDLLERVGAEVAGCGFIIDLPDLGGAARLRERGLRVHALCAFEGE
ncbi:MAG TPA: adenine phosphoribosyltransferase [Myxococcota bacterium]|nr:adenine phosphoribosyltransferase [Myxococcota bacterium]